MASKREKKNFRARRILGSSGSMGKTWGSSIISTREGFFLFLFPSFNLTPVKLHASPSAPFLILPRSYIYTAATRPPSHVLKQTRPTSQRDKQKEKTAASDRIVSLSVVATLSNTSQPSHVAAMAQGKMFLSSPYFHYHYDSRQFKY